tara:strand:- start:557 stop:781 length:225 start_codon:yes stop_codon:yes gene_type:complete
MKVGDIVNCHEYGVAIILGPCEVPQGVPESALTTFLQAPDEWPTEAGWTVQLLESENKIMSVNKSCVEGLHGSR